jgi:hypothetical protein
LIITLLFAFWLGAAALACGPFISNSLSPESNSEIPATPVVVTPIPAPLSPSPSANRAQLPTAQMAAAHSTP